MALRPTALRPFLAKALLPNFERDLSRSLSSQMATAGQMVENLMAPQAYSYQQTTVAGSGAFSSTTARQAPMTKVFYDVPKDGLFQDKEVWHHVTKSV